MRHKLFDPPVPLLDVPKSNAISLSSQLSMRKLAIKFGEQDIVHSYHRDTLGKEPPPTVPAPLRHHVHKYNQTS